MNVMLLHLNPDIKESQELLSTPTPILQKLKEKRVAS